MYSTCLFCHASLGDNQAIERFPVGRRLAFDAEKARLWVVCRRCGQWNLSPLEERWEAIEACERAFRDTRRRVQGENVGLARLPEGLELVRIGRALRPEFAAWRYGDQFGARRRRMLIGGTSIAAAGGALAVGAPLLGTAAIMAAPVLFLGINVAAVTLALRTNVLVPHPDGGRLLVTLNERAHVRLVQRPVDDGGWGLDVPYQSRIMGDVPWWRHSLNLPPEGTAHLGGAAALHAAGLLLPKINGSGAAARQVQDAVTLIEQAGGPERWFAEAAARTSAWAAASTWGDTGALRYLPAPARLALEMAAHEEEERRALEGELAELEARWRDAERIAAIADDLLLPRPVHDRLARLRTRPDRRD
jgi:hypothetical protein